MTAPLKILWPFLNPAESIQQPFRQIAPTPDPFNLMMQFHRAFSSQPNLLHIVSKLRNQTALSMNLCRKAALESNLDFKLALEILSNSANSSFKSDTTSAASNFGIEGLVGIMGSTHCKCLIEVKFKISFSGSNKHF